MVYRVIRDFSDNKDHSHVYRAGDVYPRSGLAPSEARIKELSGSNNARNVPLIQAVAKDTKEDISLTEEKAKEDKTTTKPSSASEAKGKQKKGQKKHA